MPSASILLVFGFEEAGSRYPWSNPVVISTTVCGGCLFLVFVACDYVVGTPKYPLEPVFPLQLLKDRHFVGLFLTAFFTGLPFITVLIKLPQHFQGVNGLSPFAAGVDTLPLLISSPLAAAVSGPLATKMDMPPFYLLLFGACIQMLGKGLASSATPVRLRDFLGVEVFMGFGFGMAVLLYVHFLVERQGLAVVMGAVTQLRKLGGTIGLAVGATIFNNHLASSLPNYLTPSEVPTNSDSVPVIDSLPAPTRNAVRSVFSEGENKRLLTMLYLSAVVLVSLTLM
ncbi:major facilitator superfamily transporter [Colletotrichum orchidophilum]|uniref:Major facilitator superfamily transporter n=1 Tax=Colletotrichum orchidophilum TaxID=1209926 RepID=A0A1G4BGK2_9PEZI|nr:major facilitator superfamily transporter [Colletotrichum orchidophilum]OHF00447.1 major facilitator superfamily transporter [Colletotrichum orchidophilum]